MWVLWLIYCCCRCFFPMGESYCFTLYCWCSAEIFACMNRFKDFCVPPNQFTLSKAHERFFAATQATSFVSFKTDFSPPHWLVAMDNWIIHWFWDLQVIYCCRKVFFPLDEFFIHFICAPWTNTEDILFICCIGSTQTFSDVCLSHLISCCNTDFLRCKWVINGFLLLRKSFRCASFHSFLDAPHI